LKMGPNLTKTKRWGQTPWYIDFHVETHPLPEQVDFAVVGGGFTGLSAAAWLRCLEPKKSVALFEAEFVGAGASGHTGGMVLAETAAGDLPGLGDVLAGFSGIVKELQINCDLNLPGAWEISRTGGRANSPIRWNDSGELRVAEEVPGGTVDPGKLVSGLARAGQARGAMIFENARVDNIDFGQPPKLNVCGKEVRANRVLIATNAQSLELSGLAGRAQPKFTLAVATAALTGKQRRDLGLDSARPFYTIDLPYLWGRPLGKEQLIFGSGLVHLKDWREFSSLDIGRGDAAELLKQLELRIQGLHPALREVGFTHRWGGPILIAGEWKPVFAKHPRNEDVIVLGAYSGHGVAQSVYLGSWAAEAMLERKDLPDWASAKSAG
jgi:glycine/D-amino acid oxidase-like deaminating enzyme